MEAGQAISSLDRRIFQILLGFVMLAPLPFGAVHGWAWSLLALGVGGLLVAWSRARLGGELPGATVPVGPKVTRPLLLLFAALLAWIVLQAIPGIPPRWAHPLWQEAASALGESLPGRIGIDPAAAIPALIHLGTYGGIFWLALQYGRDSARASRAIGLVAASGAAYALYGLAVHFTGGHSVLWLDKTAYRGDVSASFINRNNYATFAGLGWLCLLAQLFRGLARHAPEGSRPADWLHAVESYLDRGGWRVLLGAPILAGALLGSHSRGGLLATLFGTAIFCLALRVNAANRDGFAKRFAVIVLVLAGFAAWAGGSVVGMRLAETKGDEGRLKVFALTVDAIERRPLLGTGAGTFEEGFRMVRSPAILSTFAQAHDTYLESALELGLPALVLSVVGLVAVALLNWSGVRERRRDAVYPCLGLAATMLVAFHASVDFSIQIPAVAATYALILGVSLAQSWSSRARAGW